MSGKIVGIAILICAAIAGASLYYLQIYGFYNTVTPNPGADVMLVAQASEQPEPIAYSDFQAIDADSSPIRYRACFMTAATNAELAATHTVLLGKTPRNGPDWFDCFDAKTIDQALAAGTATTYLGEKNVSFGVDRIVAILDDGRGFVWHDLNDCGDKAYDGTITGEECPERDLDAGK